MTGTPDGVYDRTRPWIPNVEPKPIMQRWQYLGPFATNEERLTQQALQTNTLVSEDLANLVRVPLPQVSLFPPRYGYDRTVPGILDIIEVNRQYTEPRVAWNSGSAAGYSGASRNALGEV